MNLVKVYILEVGDILMPGVENYKRIIKKEFTLAKHR